MSSEYGKEKKGTAEKIMVENSSNVNISVISVSAFIVTVHSREIVLVLGLMNHFYWNLDILGILLRNSRFHFNLILLLAIDDITLTTADRDIDSLLPGRDRSPGSSLGPC